MSDLVGNIMNASELAYWVAGLMAIIAGILVWIMSAQVWMACIFGPASFFGALTGVYVGRESAVRLHNVIEGDIVLWCAVGMIVTSGVLLVIMRLLYWATEPRKGVVRPGPVTR